MGIPLDLGEVGRGVEIIEIEIGVIFEEVGVRTEEGAEIEVVIWEKGLEVRIGVEIVGIEIGDMTVVLAVAIVEV